jgi:glycosyltransferase involved in cell wall biosynthesis
MKILYLHQYFKFPNESGGTRSYDLATGFTKKGYTIDVVTSTSNSQFKTKKRWLKILKDDLTIHYIYLPYGNHLSYFKRILVFIQFIWFATFKLLSLRCDIVLATSTPLTIGIPALIKKWFHKTPFVFEARDVWPEAVIAIGAVKNILIQKFLYFLEKTIYKNAAAIVPLSIDMKASIVNRYPMITATKQVEVVENISEVNRFQKEFTIEYSVLENKIGFTPRFSVLYAGTFGRVNGLEYVINLAEKTKSLDISLVFILIGDGALKEAVIKLSKEKKVLNKNVFILDSVSKQKLPLWYHEVSMGSSFVIQIKELWANSANKFFDTLAAGKPILINHPGWQKKTIQNQNVGYVLPEKVSDKAAKEFVDYTLNVELLSKQKTNALALAKKKYSLEVAVDKYMKLFNSIDKSSNV